MIGKVHEGQSVRGVHPSANLNQNPKIKLSKSAFGSEESLFLRACNKIKNKHCIHDIKRSIDKITDINEQGDSFGKTILHYAIEHENPEAVAYLMKVKNARVDIPDWEGNTAIHLLFKSGRDIDTSIFFWAIEPSFSTLTEFKKIEILENALAIKNVYGETPFYLADKNCTAHNKYNCHKNEIIEILKLKEKSVINTKNNFLNRTSSTTKRCFVVQCICFIIKFISNFFKSILNF